MNEYNCVARKLSVAFCVNKDTDSLIKDQLAEFTSSLHIIDMQLTNTLLQNSSIINRLLQYGSLPIADRYKMVHINTAHDEIIGNLRVLLDDIQEAAEVDIPKTYRPQFFSLKMKAIGILFSATQMQMILQAGIAGKPLPDLKSLRFDFSPFIN